MKTETYTLPAHWASYLINGDASSFDLYDEGDAEIASIDRWLEANNLGLCVGCGDEPYFSRWNDGPSDLAGDMLDFEFETLSEK